MTQQSRLSHEIVLLTGATGYVGGRLLSALEGRGLAVRCMVRDPSRLRRPVVNTTEVVQGDVFDGESLRRALHGVTTAYYLVHSMGTAEHFAKADSVAASNFAAAAARAGVRRIVYLGGLGHGDALSEHLESRQAVGRILAGSGAMTVEFRASIVIGSGSLSFEMIRGLVQKLPVMVTPRWVRTPAQPIAIEDVIDYLVAGLSVHGRGHQVFEIGGADRVSYREIMQEFAKQRGLRRLMVPVPVLSSRLSSLWLGLVTPIYARVGRKLVLSLRNPTVVRDPRALDVFPIRPRGFREAIARALVNEDRQFAQTRWTDALSSPGPQRQWGGRRMGSRIVDSRVRRVAAGPSDAFRPIRRIGGGVGWYYANWLWRLRGLLDLMAGGVGIRRGRRDPERLRVGDTVDFWRVRDVEPGRLLRLEAEMKLPGRAWLQFEVEPDGDGALVRQTAIFDPYGLFGLAYWYGLFPLHSLIFAGMLRRIGSAATAAVVTPPASSPWDRPGSTEQRGPSWLPTRHPPAAV
jgi:uncharacterized protein YbjT (DUF2867 family)